MKDTWIKRCCVCGWYARGYGQMPRLEDHWVCGLCELAELDLDPPRVY